MSGLPSSGPRARGTRRSRVLPGVLSVLLLAGAAADGDGCRGGREVPVRSLGSGLQCGGDSEGPSARRLASQEELARALSPAFGAPAADFAVDFAREAAVLVSAGRKPTAGYGVELVEPRAAVKDGTAALRVRFTAPAPGMITAQVLTSPCLVVVLPTEGVSEVAVVEGERVVARAPLR